MIRIGIIGGAGYTAGELCRILLNHPEAEIVFVNSESNAGNLLAEVHEGLYGETDMRFTDQLPFDQVDVVFELQPTQPAPAPAEPAKPAEQPKAAQ